MLAFGFTSLVFLFASSAVDFSSLFSFLQPGVYLRNNIIYKESTQRKNREEKRKNRSKIEIKW
jgi:hypothetical protein